MGNTDSTAASDLEQFYQFCNKLQGSMLFPKEFKLQQVASNLKQANLQHCANPFQTLENIAKKYNVEPTIFACTASKGWAILQPPSMQFTCKLKHQKQMQLVIGNQICSVQIYGCMFDYSYDREGYDGTLCIFFCLYFRL